MAKTMKSPPLMIGPPGVLGHLFALALSAVLMGVIYPTLGWWGFAYVALVPGALLARHATSMLRLTLVSMGVFWVWWVVMLWWLTPVTLGGTIAASLILSLFPTLGWLLIRRLTLQGRLSLTVAVPVVWVMVEYLRTMFPFGGFAWFLLGHSQGPWLPEHSSSLIQTASLFGELTVTGYVAVINGFIADVLHSSFSTPKPGEFKPPFRKRLIGRTAGVVVVGVLVAVCANVPIFRLDVWGDSGVEGVGDARLVTVIQTDEPQSNRQSPSLEDRIRYWHELLTETVASEASPGKIPGDIDGALLADLLDSGEPDASRVVIWPESAVPVGIDAKTLAWAEEHGFERFGVIEGQIRDLAESLGVDLIVGAPSYERWVEVELEDGRTGWMPDEPANSVFHYTPKGEQGAERYDKMHRVPFGEYLPIVDYLPWLKGLVVKYLTPYDVDYTIVPGERPVVFETGGLAVVSAICFEDTVARVCQQLVAHARETSERSVLIASMTNDGWFSVPGQGYQHLQIAVFRCVENRVPMAKAANTGVSGVIDERGQILGLVEVDGERKGVRGHLTSLLETGLGPYLSGVQRRYGGVTLYGYWGENPLVVLCVVLALLGSGLFDRPKRAKD